MKDYKLSNCITCVLQVSLFWFLEFIKGTQRILDCSEIIWCCWCSFGISSKVLGCHSPLTKEVKLDSLVVSCFFIIADFFMLVTGLLLIYSLLHLFLVPCVTFVLYTLTFRGPSWQVIAIRGSNCCNSVKCIIVVNTIS